MIPDNRFSSQSFKGTLYNPWTGNLRVSQHWGPVAIQDVSQGLGVKLWTAKVENQREVVVSAPGVSPVVWYTHSADITQLSLSFDQNGRPAVVIVGGDGQGFLRWFDPVPNAIVNLNISYAITPKVTLDDNRPFNGAHSDIILAYVRAGFVRFRQQRDRFTIEYTPTLGPSGSSPVTPVLTNPGFDSNADGYDLHGVGGLPEWSASGGRSSPGCVRMIVFGSGEYRDGVVVTDQQLDIPTGARISASVYCKMAQGTYGTSFRVQLRWFDADHNYISDFLGPERSRGLVGSLWVSSTSGLRLPPANARFFEVAALLNGSSVGTNEFFVDDFSVMTDAGGGGGGGSVGQPAPATMLRHVSMNSRFRLEFLTDGLGSEPWTLAEVVQDLCVRGGVPAQNIDVSELWSDFVYGFPVNADDGFDKPIQELRDVYQFDKSQYDRRLYFPKRGRPIAAWIPYKDLVPKSPATLAMEYINEQDLPRDVVVNHLDPDAGHSGNFQRAFRRSNQVHTDKTEKIDTKVVMKAGQAVTVAWRKLKERWAELIIFKFTTTLRYTRLTPADVVMVQDSEGEWHRVRLEDRNEDTGNIDWEAKLDAGEQAYELNASELASSVQPPTSTTPGQVGETHIEIINVSPLLDQHDELGLYVAGAGLPGSLWRGYQLLLSVDSGNAYAEVASSSVPSIIGESLSDLSAEAGKDITSAWPVEVKVNFPLSSVQESDLDFGRNVFCLGDEIGQFQFATLLNVVDGMYHYELSNLRRAKYNTDAAAWPAGTRFVLIDESLVYVQLQRSNIGLDLEFKPVSLGQSSDAAIPTAYLFDEPLSQTEWPVIDAQAEIDPNGNVKVEWTPRPRLGQFGTPFNSKYFDGFRLTFSDAVVVTTRELSYTRAGAPVDLESVTIEPMNTITGAGPAVVVEPTPVAEVEVIRVVIDGGEVSP